MFVRVMVPAITSILCGVVFFFILNHDDKVTKDFATKDIFTIRPSKAFLVVGLIGIVIFGGFMAKMCFFPDGSEAWWVWMGFSFFVLLGIYLVLMPLMLKIVIFKSEDYFKFRIHIKTYTVKYGDCEWYRVGKYAFVLKLKNRSRKFFVDQSAIDCTVLKRMLDLNRVKRNMPKKKTKRKL